MLKNKILPIIIALVILITAGLGIYKVYTVNKSNSTNTETKGKDDSTNLSYASKNENNDNSENTSKNESNDDNSSNTSKNKSNDLNKEKSDKTKKTSTVSKSTENAASTNSKDSTKKLKSEYLSKLAQVEKQDKECGLDSAKTTADMKIAQGKRYTLWDNELNNIYSELKNNLSKNEMAKLEKEETAWIKEKESNAENKAAQYKGGTFEGVAKTQSLADDTKKRCYYLVNNYM